MSRFIEILNHNITCTWWQLQFRANTYFFRLFPKSANQSADSIITPFANTLCWDTPCFPMVCDFLAITSNKPNLFCDRCSGGLWQRDIDMNKWDYVYKVFGTNLAQMSIKYMSHVSNSATLLRMTSAYLSLSNILNPLKDAWKMSLLWSHFAHIFEGGRGL